MLVGLGSSLWTKADLHAGHHKPGQVFVTEADASDAEVDELLSALDQVRLGDLPVLYLIYQHLSIFPPQGHAATPDAAIHPAEYRDMPLFLLYRRLQVGEC